jgi:hypothetical protein
LARSRTTLRFFLALSERLTRAIVQSPSRLRLLDSAAMAF